MAQINVGNVDSLLTSKKGEWDHTVGHAQFIYDPEKDEYLSGVSERGVIFRLQTTADPREGVRQYFSLLINVLGNDSPPDSSFFKK